MNYRIGLMSMGFLLALQPLFADNKTWYVNNRAANASDSNDGLTAETPLLTINAATTNEAFEAGDTVLVYPGVYNSETVAISGYRPTRVYIPKKTILKAYGSKEETIIEGKLGTTETSATTKGLGTDSVRAIMIGSDAKDTEIIGFTIRNGATQNKDSTPLGSGGGILADGNAYVVDCIISNCVAFKGGGMFKGTAIRTLFYKNKAYGSSSGNCGAAANSANLFNCIINQCNGTRKEDLKAALSECTSVNCTVYNCKNVISTGKIYNSVFSDIASIEKTGNGTVSKCSRGEKQLIAPGLNDYRLIDGAYDEELACAATEVTTRLSSLPEKYRTTDFAGNPFPQSGTCLPGAIQKAAVIKGGAIQAKGKNLIIDGKVLPAGEYIFPESWPTQFLIQAEIPEGEHLWGFVRDVANGGRIFPNRDNTALIMPSPDISNVCTTEPIITSNAYYVNPNPEIGSDENTGTIDAPFLTLQIAVDKCEGHNSITDCAVIYAAEGDYNQGGKTIASTQPSYSALTNRVCVGTGKRFVRIVGAGAGKSFISGAPDPITGGNGPGAIRPIGIFSHDTAVQGFTIRNGYVKSVDKEIENISAILGRNVDFSLNGNVLTITDCDITGNTAYGSNGAVALYANLQRCRIYGNNGGGLVLPAKAKAASVLVYDNVIKDNGAVFAGCQIANSTARAGSNVYMQSTGTARIYASILDGGKSIHEGNKIYGSLVNNRNAKTLNEECDVAFGNPCFINPQSGDFGVFDVSRALNAGDVPSADNWGTNWWKLAASGDIDGKRLIFNNDKPLAGAVSKVSPLNGAFVHAVNGGLSVESGAIELGDGEQVALTLGEGTRPVIGIAANGETNLFTEGSSFTVTANDSLYIEPIYTTHWYVDDENGSNDKLGFTPFAAKKTFKDLIENCNIIAGDTIHAAEGTYDEGDMIAEGEKVGSRIIVPAGVTVVADGEIEKTIIKGKAATIEPSEYGLGSNAVRCVALNVNSKIKGFTLTGGYTGRHGNSNANAENFGAGAFGIGADERVGIVENCIISNNIAFRGGGAAYTTLIKCRVFKNRGCDSEGGGSGAYRSSVYGSIFAKNAGIYCVMYSTPIVATTIADVNGTTYALYNSDGCTIKNCILNCGVKMKKDTAKAYYTFFKESPNVDDGVDLLQEGCSIAGGNLKFWNGYYPAIGGNAAVDQGSIEHHDAGKLGDTDLLGNPRIANGAIDAGALEADWREVYADALAGGSSYFKVDNASPNVVLAEDATLTVNDGQTLEASCIGKRGRTVRYQVALRVTGNGTLAVVADGKETAYTAGDGDVTLSFLSSADKLSLVFAYAGGENDGGAAQILSVSRQLGLWMTVR